jgi:hypothetical protein
MVERAIIRIIHNKIFECKFKPSVKIIIFMHLNTVTVWEGEPNTAWSKGENHGNMEKNTIFLSHIKFFTSFLSQVGINQTRGKILYCFSSSHIQEAV